jgi:hypothetical protein
VAHEALPLTFGQLSLCRPEQEISVDNRQEWRFVAVWQLPDQTPVTAVQEALDLLEQRHDALRAFIDDTTARPRQIVRSAAGVPMDIVAVPAAECSANRAQELGRALSERPFDLTAEHGWRVGALTDGVYVRYVSAAVHHMSADGWAPSLLETEFDHLIAGPPPSPLPPARLPRELAEQQLSEKWRSRNEAAERYWRTVLGDFAEPAPDQAEMSYGIERHRLRRHGLYSLAAADRAPAAPEGGRPRRTAVRRPGGRRPSVGGRAGRADDADRRPGAFARRVHRSLSASRHGVA